MQLIHFQVGGGGEGVEATIKSVVSLFCKGL